MINYLSIFYILSTNNTSILISAMGLLGLYQAHSMPAQEIAPLTLFNLAVPLKAKESLSLSLVPEDLELCFQGSTSTFYQRSPGQWQDGASLTGMWKLNVLDLFPDLGLWCPAGAWNRPQWGHLHHGSGQTLQIRVLFVSSESQSSSLGRAPENEISGGTIRYLPVPKVDGRIWSPT